MEEKVFSERMERVYLLIKKLEKGKYRGEREKE